MIAFVILEISVRLYWRYLMAAAVDKANEEKSQEDDEEHPCDIHHRASDAG